MSRMFPFITHTWNPLCGVCPHNCKGCWAKAYIKRMRFPKYQGQYRIDPKQINKKFPNGSFVFVCDMLDLFAKDVPMEAIQLILQKIREQPNVTFLLLTKNPRYMWLMDLPHNVVAGATIETNFDPSLYGFHYSQAPKVKDRIKAMQEINHPHKFISIEPIMEFSLGSFLEDLFSMKPNFVAVGFDNYNSNLPEPETLEKVHDLIKALESKGIVVYKKTLREPIDQEQAFQFATSEKDRENK